MSDSVRPYQVIVFYAGDKDGKGAGVLYNDVEIAPASSNGHAVATLLAAWNVPADKQNADDAARLRISVTPLQ